MLGVSTVLCVHVWEKVTTQGRLLEDCATQAIEKMGPEPRSASANKICFSGVGDISTDGGKRDVRSALFRVDIEDRSEPGGDNLKGRNPADRYRIRIWILTDDELDSLNDEEDQLLDFRQKIACSEDSTVTTDGAPGDLGSAVFNVRAPDIDDGGEMDSGNHQIHPTVKECL